jgi:acyl-CoA reductase-like NAD-dependent aldehyde dehydrogenase
MKICSEEAFAPIVILEKYTDFKEVMARVNNSAFGLQAGVFTNDIHEMFYAYDALDVGGVIINNTPTFRADHMPYGGVKDSGIGREGVRYAMEDMTERKALIINKNV